MIKVTCNIFTVLVISVLVSTLHGAKGTTTNTYNWNFYIRDPNGTDLAKYSFQIPNVPPDMTHRAQPEPEQECEPKTKTVVVLPPEGVYWKDFRGPPVPKDAVEAGVDKKSGTPRTVYIGQVFSSDRKSLLPVAIYNDTDEVTSSSKQITTTSTKYIKILCSSKPPEGGDELLIWVDNQIAATHSDKDLVEAGTENGNPVYFGRGQFRNQLVVGKAVRMDWSFKLYFPFDGKEMYTLNDVEVLGYSSRFNSDDNDLPEEQ